jgi:L,D-transpeptidase ErfK/SrfK
MTVFILCNLQLTVQYTAHFLSFEIMLRIMFLRVLFSLLALSWISSASALTFNLPTNGDNVVGHTQWAQAVAGDTFSSIGRRYDVGYYQLVEANPGVDPNNPPAGTIIVIPTKFVLPPVARTGVVVNLAELRIYYYPPNSGKVVTYPIGIGREGWDTPVGIMSITEKTVNPTWYAPASIREARAKDGVEIPKIVPPGPDNPLGGYRMRLTKPTYLIHGTNDYRGVGRRSSSGCIRMFPEDVEALFSRVHTGTAVNIINSAYKAGWLNGQLYLEAHVPLQEQQQDGSADIDDMKKIVNSAILSHSGTLNWDTADHIATIQNGIPQIIGHKNDVVEALATNNLETDHS